MAECNYRILVGYDGTKYRGWQVQKNTELTIQGKIQTVLERLVHHPVEVIGSGRTDAGVHAIGQVANFHMEEMDKTELLETLNRYLPEDIAVYRLEVVDERFHSRYHAESKTYRYRIHTSIIPNVFERRYVYNYTETLNVANMRQAAEFVIGTQDFRSFCGNRHMKKSTVRTISSIDIRQTGSELTIDYTGDGFLQNMVRILTGTLIEIGNGTRQPQEMASILAGKDRSLAGYTAPPQGLALLEVRYAPEWTSR